MTFVRGGDIIFCGGVGRNHVVDDVLMVTNGGNDIIVCGGVGIDFFVRRYVR
jgi:hypothetical protein